MNEIAIFGFGSFLFILTAWATFAFGLHRVHELQLRDVADTNRSPVDRPGGLTEIYVTHADADDHGSVVAEQS